MKENSEAIESIYNIVKEIDHNIDIADLLFRHECFYLLTKIENNKYKERISALKQANELYVNEGYLNSKKIFQTFIENKIPFAVIKGAVLSKIAYGNQYERFSHDIDILVNRRDVGRVKDIMSDDDFIQGRVTLNGIQKFSRKKILLETITSHQIAPFVKSTANEKCPYIDIDINVDIMWGESTQKVDLDFVLDNTMISNVCGVRIKKLTPEMEFVALCMHHYKDMNSLYLLYQGKLKLNLFCDLFFYLKNQKLDTKFLQEICRKLNVTEYVYYCLYYTNLIFDDSYIEALCQKFFSKRGEMILEQFGLAENEFHKWSIDFYHRLFSIDMPEYLETVLTEKELKKIELNKAMIEMM